MTAAKKLIGVCGAPEHVVGNVNVTGLEDPLDPAALTARTLNVYCPAGTAENENDSVTGSCSEVVIAPVTSTKIDAGAPPANVLRHDRVRAEPFTAPRRFVGAVGPVAVLTCTRISLDARLLTPPDIV